MVVGMWKWCQVVILVQIVGRRSSLSGWGGEREREGKKES